MKQIDYTTRALFEEFSSEDSIFIRQLIKELDIRSALEIPCANGRNLSVIGDIVSSAFFADINLGMVEIVRQKISNEKRNNCEALVLDLCDLSNIHFNVDAILVMQQSFQMLTAESGRRSLRNLRKVRCRYIVIDIYDFLCGASDRPHFLASANTFVDNKSRSWIRHSSISGISDRQVQIIHNYRSEKEACFAEVSLCNYSRNEFITLCEECGHKIYDYYTSYSFDKDLALGRTIFVLAGCEGVEA